MTKTRAFKSGNSTAVRIPKEFGIEPGTEVRLSREGGRVIIDRVDAEPETIDLTGIYGSMPDLKPLTPEERLLEERPLPWDLLRDDRDRS